MVVNRPVIVITHAGGIRTSYEPVETAVPVGTTVIAGQVVGHVSSATGHCGGRDCLHWGARRGTIYVDPLQFLRPPHVVLLPLGGPSG